MVQTNTLNNKKKQIKVQNIGTAKDMWLAWSLEKGMRLQCYESEQSSSFQDEFTNTGAFWTWLGFQENKMRIILLLFKLLCITTTFLKLGEEK